MSYRAKVAERARREKEKHPDRFCSTKHCLWRTHMPDGTRRSWCKNHESSEKAAYYAKQIEQPAAAPEVPPPNA